MALQCIGGRTYRFRYKFGGRCQIHPFRRRKIKRCLGRGLYLILIFNKRGDQRLCMDNLLISERRRALERGCVINESLGFKSESRSKSLFGGLLLSGALYGLIY